MNTNEEKISPALASDYLKRNRTNRPYKEAWSNDLARQMRDGLWKEKTAEAIKFSSSGNLIDGQHRLNAVIKSGKTFTFLVVRDLPDDIFSVLDTGKKRSACDVLSISGCKRGKAISSVIVAIENIKLGVVNNQNRGSYKLNNEEVLAIYLERPLYWEELIKLSDRYNSLFKMLSTTTIGSFYHIFSQINEPKSKEFFDLLCSGANIHPTSPVLLLRKRIIDEAGQLQKTPIIIMRALIIKTWNAFINGEVLRILRFSPQVEEYPKIL